VICCLIDWSHHIKGIHGLIDGRSALEKAQTLTKLFLLSSILIVISSCSSDTQYQTMNLDRLNGKTIEEIINFEGQPVRRSDNQLIYEYDTSERVTPWWAAIVLAGLAGGGGGTNFPDMSYISRNSYCLILDFENDVLKRQTMTNRREDESC